MNKPQNQNIFLTFQCHKIDLLALFMHQNNRFPYPFIYFNLWNPYPFIVLYTWRLKTVSLLSPTSMSINDLSEIYIFLSWGKSTDHLKGHKDWLLDCYPFTFLTENYDITFIILHSYNSFLDLILSVLQ